MDQRVVPSRLSEVSFVDLYAGRFASHLSGVVGEYDPVPVPEHLIAEVSELRDVCAAFYKNDGRPEFSIRFGGTTYRVSLLKTISGLVFVLRKFADKVPTWAECKYPKGIVSRLMAPRLSGLVVLSGSYGQGKTTTASVLLSSRLAAMGGVGITIEDPPEMPLEGMHGDGVCYQTEVRTGEFGVAVKSAARWSPSMILLGEVRDAEAAGEALQASLNGRLVICTFHADSVVGAIERLYSLVVGVRGSSEDASSMMAHGLCAVLHQRLEYQPWPGVQGQEQERTMRVEGLFVREPGFEGVAHTIRNRRFGQLGSEISRQSNLLAQEVTK